jgi:hypothetical protein
LVLVVPAVLVDRHKQVLRVVKVETLYLVQ